MIEKFLPKTSKASPAPKSSDFSSFFHTAKTSEKKRVYMDVARKAAADQSKIIKRNKPTCAS